jgi:hypothetical protein
MSRRLSLDVKPAAPSVAPPIVRRFADSSIGFKGREIIFNQPGDAQSFAMKLYCYEKVWFQKICLQICMSN